MSEKELRVLIDAASSYAELMIKESGEVAPALMMESDKKKAIVPVPMSDKNFTAALMRALLKEMSATRCVFISEGWTLAVDAKEMSADDLERAQKLMNKEGISEHPDRIEIVMMNGEDAGVGFLSAQRRIIRADDKVSLGPLEIHRIDGAEGRMIGLLPREAGGKLS